MPWISVDIEADGPIPGDYSMVCFGAVVVEPGLNRTFYSGLLKPISTLWLPEALEISGFTREEMYKDGGNPHAAMSNFRDWVDNLGGRPMFIADNNGFDWMFICWYFHHYLGENPFGFSSQNLNSLYKGLKNNMFKSFKHLRKTPHDHNPVNDAKGNAEVILHLKEKEGLKIKL